MDQNMPAANGRAVSPSEIVVSSNAIVAIACVVIAAFMLFMASVCSAIMRSDAEMIVFMRPKICLVPHPPGRIATAPRGASAR